MKMVQTVTTSSVLFITLAVLLMAGNAHAILTPEQAVVESKPVAYYVSPQTPCYENGDLLDGVVPSAWDSAGWTKFYQPYYGVAEPNDVPYAVVTFDLGKVDTVDNFVVSYFGGVGDVGGYGIWAPVSYDISYSTSFEEASFSAPVNYPAKQQAYSVTDTVELGGIQARYVRFKFNIPFVSSPVYYPMFYLGEVAYNHTSVVPYTYDPATTPYSGEAGRTLYNGIDDLSQEYVYFVPGELNQPPYVIFTFDLQEVGTLDNFQISYEELYNIHRPGKIQVFCSETTPDMSLEDPNMLFTEIPGSSNGGYYRSIFNLEGTPARYVKFKLDCLEDNAGNWMRIGEISFNVEDASQNARIYEIDPTIPPLSWRPDDTGRDLTNGIKATGDVDHVDWVEWAPSVSIAESDLPYAIVTFETADLTAIDNVEVCYLNMFPENEGDDHVSAPENMEISYSDDGVTFTEPVTVAGFDTTTEGALSTIFPLAGTAANYVKIKFNCKDNDTGKWIMLSEVEFNGTPDPVSPYTIDETTPVWADRGDDTGWDLYNGEIAQDWDTKDWVEWAPSAQDPVAPAYAIINFDMQADYEFNNIVVAYMNSPSAGVYAPASLEISYSNDGIMYSSPVTLTGFNDVKDNDGVSLVTLFELDGTSARYARLKFNCGDNDSSKWMFLSEITFNGNLKGYFDITADVNFDDKVDNCDIAEMAAGWNQSNLINIAGVDYCQLPPAGDLNGDCAVNLDDFMLLVPEWLYDNTVE